MNDLQRYFPNQQLARIEDLLTVESWEDFRRVFLLGEGNSTNTVRAYETAGRQFYDYTGGLHPMQAGTPERIEQYYDSIVTKGCTLTTACLRMRGLKYIYKRIAERVPFYQSPFEIMPDKLTKKLFRTEQDESERGALALSEYQAIEAMLRADMTVYGWQNLSFVAFAVSTGMRAAELVGLHWRNISTVDGRVTATFIGKGRKKRTVQTDPEAVDVCRRAFRLRFGKKPTPDDYVFNSMRGPGVSKVAIHNRIKAAIEMAKARGLVRANLNVSTHTMRHTYTTLALESGVDIHTIQKQLGHASLGTTSRYAHTNQDQSEYFERLRRAE